MSYGISFCVNFATGEITSSTNMPKIVRDKGFSIVDFPKDYTVIDTETTGLDSLCDCIIEVAAVRYRNGQKVAEFNELIRPDDDFAVIANDNYEDYIFDSDGKKIVFVDGYITALTGITNKMLEHARSEEEVIDDYLSFIGENEIVVGHNVQFDVRFIYDAAMRQLEKKFKNNHIDTCRISKKLLPELGHHRLIDLCNYYKIITENSHRALADVETTNAVFKCLEKDVIEKYQNIDLFTASYKKNHRNISAKDFKAQDGMANPNSPFYCKNVCITGALERMTRAEAMQLLVNIGAINNNSVTKKTEYLILGNNDYCSTIKDGKSTKQKKAEELKLKGQDIEIISENTFYEMLEDGLSEK